MAKPSLKTPINKNEVRILTESIGYIETSKRLGIKYATLRQWSKRENWRVPKAGRSTSFHVVPHALALSQNVTTSDALADTLQDYRKRSRTALAKYSAEAAEAAADHPKKLRVARAVRDVASVHQTVWPEQTQQNVLQLNVLSQVTLDKAVEPQD
jgi:hypothetical protein